MKALLLLMMAGCGPQPSTAPGEPDTAVESVDTGEEPLVLNDVPSWKLPRTHLTISAIPRFEVQSLTWLRLIAEDDQRERLVVSNIEHLCPILQERMRGWHELEAAYRAALADGEEPWCQATSFYLEGNATLSRPWIHNGAAALSFWPTNKHGTAYRLPIETGTTEYVAGFVESFSDSVFDIQRAYWSESLCMWDWDIQPALDEAKDFYLIESGVLDVEVKPNHRAVGTLSASLLHEDGELAATVDAEFHAEYCEVEVPTERIYGVDGITIW